METCLIHWSTKSKDNLLKRRHVVTGVFDNRFIVVAGGYNEYCDSFITAFMYDTQTSKCILLPDLPKIFESSFISGDNLRCYGTVLHTYFYIIHGGMRSMWRIDLCEEGSLWEQVMPPWIIPEALVSNGRNLCLFGPKANKLYYPERNEWADLPPMPTPRTQYCTAIVGNDVYKIGGYVHPVRRPSSTMEIFHISTRMWSPAPLLPIPLAGAAATVVVGIFIVITGGKTRNDEYSAQTLIYNSRTQQWSQSHLGLIPPRFNHACVTVGNYQIYSVGGEGSDPRPDKYAMYTLDTINAKYFIPDLASFTCFIHLRKLVYENRAFPKIRTKTANSHQNTEYGDMDTTLQKVVTDLDDALFQFIFSFII